MGADRPGHPDPGSRMVEAFQCIERAQPSTTCDCLQVKGVERLLDQYEGNEAEIVACSKGVLRLPVV